MLEIHSDNGSEFFNHHLLRLWKDVVQGVQLSRSRPYQKNATLVWAYQGYDRFVSVAQTKAINQLYDKMWLYYKLFSHRDP